VAGLAEPLGGGAMVGAVLTVVGVEGPEAEGVNVVGGAIRAD